MPKSQSVKKPQPSAMSETKNYHLYILLCDQKILYTGIALDPEARLKQHQQGAPYGAKFTRKFKCLEIVYQVKIGDKVMAHRLEYRIKKWSRKKKLQLIKEQPAIQKLLSTAGLTET